MPATSILKRQVKKYVDTASEKDLKIIYQLFELDKDKDWWADISKEHKKNIIEAIAEADSGKVIPHAEMVKKYRKWLKK